MGINNLDFSFRKRAIKKFDTIYVQDFGDDYHEDRSNRNDLDIKVRSIKSMYTNFNLYIQAKEVYEKYMEMLYVKYGGEKVFNTLSADGMISDYVPPLPKLKNNTTATNDFLKYGICNSGFASKMTPHAWKQAMEGIRKTANEIIQYESEVYGFDPDDYLEDEEYLSAEYRWDNMEDSEIHAISRITKDTGKKKSRVMSASELTDRFYSAQMTEEANDPYNDNRRYPTLAEALSDDYDPDKYDIDKKMKEEGEANTLYNVDGRMVTASALKEHEIYEALSSLGWNGSMIRYRKSGGRDVSEDIIYETMTASEKKRYKREKRREKKERMKRQKGAEKEFSKKLDNMLLAEAEMFTDMSFDSFEDYEAYATDLTIFDQFGKF